MSKRQVPVYLDDVEVAGFLFKVEEDIAFMESDSHYDEESWKKAQDLRKRLNKALSSFYAPDNESSTPIDDQDDNMPF